MVVGAAQAGALLRAHLTLPKALTVHFEALGLFAGAAGFFLLGDGGGCGDFIGLFLDLVLNGEFRLLLLFGGWGDVVVEADNGGHVEAAVGLDEEERLVDVWK